MARFPRILVKTGGFAPAVISRFCISLREKERISIVITVICSVLKIFELPRASNWIGGFRRRFVDFQIGNCCIESNAFFVDKAKTRLEELKGQLNANIAAIAGLNQTFEATNNGYKARVKELSEITEQFNVDRIEATTKLDALLDEVLKSLHEYRVLYCEMYREKNCVSSVDYDVATLEDIRNYYNLK